MKKLIACIAFISVLSACHKKSNPACNNTISVVDNGNTYTQCVYEPPPSTIVSVGTGKVIPWPSVSVYLIKPLRTGYSYDTGYTINIFAGNNPFVLSLQHCISLTAGAGTYTVLPQDSSINSYQEQFSGGQSYECSSGIITVNHADSSNVSGTFVLNVFNATGSKTIAGSFNANQPYFSY